MNFPPLGVAKRFITYTSKAAHSTHFNRSTFCSFIYMYIYIHTYIYKHIFKFLYDLSLHSFSSLFLFLPISLYFPRSAVYIFFAKVLVVDVSYSRRSIRRVQRERQNKRKRQTENKETEYQRAGSKRTTMEKGESLYS